MFYTNHFFYYFKYCTPPLVTLNLVYKCSFIQNSHFIVVHNQSVVLSANTTFTYLVLKKTYTDCFYKQIVHIIMVYYVIGIRNGIRPREDTFDEPVDSLTSSFGVLLISSNVKK